MAREWAGLLVQVACFVILCTPSTLRTVLPRLSCPCRQAQLRPRTQNFTHHVADAQFATHITLLYDKSLSRDTEVTTRNHVATISTTAAVGSNMHLERGAGLPAIQVEDIVGIARAAGRVIMNVYKTDPEVR